MLHCVVLRHESVIAGQRMSVCASAVDEFTVDGFSGYSPVLLV